MQIHLDTTSKCDFAYKAGPDVTLDLKPSLETLIKPQFSKYSTYTTSYLKREGMVPHRVDNMQNYVNKYYM